MTAFLNRLGPLGKMDMLTRTGWGGSLLLAGIILILALAIPYLRGSVPQLANASRRPVVPAVELPLTNAEALLAWSGAALATNLPNPVYTTYFQPPAPPPAPKPATTRKVDLLFQGSFEVADSSARAFVKSGDNLVIGPAGTRVVADWTIAEVSKMGIILTNNAGQSNRLEFNKPAQVEVPVQ